MRYRERVRQQTQQSTACWRVLPSKIVRDREAITLTAAVQSGNALFLPSEQFYGVFVIELKQDAWPSYFGKLAMRVRSLAVNSKGNLVVLPADSKTIQIFDSDGHLLLKFGCDNKLPAPAPSGSSSSDSREDEAQLLKPIAMALDANDSFFIFSTRHAESVSFGWLICVE